VAIDPHSPIRRDAHSIASWLAEDAGYNLSNFSILLFAKAMFGRFCQDFVQIGAARSIRIATTDNNRTGFFNFGLTHCGLAQATLLFGAADYDEAPRLKVVTAWRFQTGSQDRGQHVVGNRRAVETWCGSPLCNGFT